MRGPSGRIGGLEAVPGGHLGHQRYGDFRGRNLAGHGRGSRGRLSSLHHYPPGESVMERGTLDLELDAIRARLDKLEARDKRAPKTNQKAPEQAPAAPSAE